jgi:hypothetical protein
MYRDKQFHIRPLAETLEDIVTADRSYGDRVRKVFVMDGDALAMELVGIESMRAPLYATTRSGACSVPISLPRGGLKTEAAKKSQLRSCIPSFLE